MCIYYVLTLIKYLKWNSTKSLDNVIYYLQQEPGWDGAEILRGVKYVRPGNDFVPNFQMFEKIDVNGDKEHPLYTYLKVGICK